jgi:hypothetical protein
MCTTHHLIGGSIYVQNCWEKNASKWKCPIYYVDKNISHSSFQSVQQTLNRMKNDSVWPVHIHGWQWNYSHKQRCNSSCGNYQRTSQFCRSCHYQYSRQNVLSLLKSHRKLFMPRMYFPLVSQRPRWSKHRANKAILLSLQNKFNIIYLFLQGSSLTIEGKTRNIFTPALFHISE